VAEQEGNGKAIGNAPVLSLRGRARRGITAGCEAVAECRGEKIGAAYEGGRREGARWKDTREIQTSEPVQAGSRDKSLWKKTKTANR